MTNHNATMTSMTSKGGGRRGLTLGIAAAAAIGMFLGGMGATASADPTDDPGGPSNGHAIVSVNVGQGILLTGINNLTLTGASGELVDTTLVPETFNVKTNAVAGYTVSVSAHESTLVKGLDSIPIGYLEVAGDGAFSEYVPFVAGALATDPTAALPVHSQAIPSAIDGDDLINNYRMDIPGVPAGTYTVTLDYVAAVL